MTKRTQVLDRQIDNLKREIEAATGVCSELADGALEACDTAIQELVKGMPREKAEGIHALFDSYFAKREVLRAAEYRKTEAMFELFKKLGEPIL